MSLRGAYPEGVTQLARKLAQSRFYSQTSNVSRLAGSTSGKQGRAGYPPVQQTGRRGLRATYRSRWIGRANRRQSLGEGRPLPGTRVASLIDILAPDEEE